MKNNTKNSARKPITVILFAVMIVAGVLAVTPAAAQDDDYCIYGNITVSGYAVDGYRLNDTAGLLYVDNGGTCYIYLVSIPVGSDPNQHPSNPDPEAQGEMAERTFIRLDDIAYDFNADCGCAASHHAEFYVDADHDYIYYGAYNGIDKWDKNADGSFGTYLGRVTDKNGSDIPGNGDETFAYDVDNNIFYSCSRGRTVQSFDANVDTAWKTEFTYPTYGGGHHDGMEFVNGYLWISDMTTDMIGQWEKQPDGSWIEKNNFSYSYGEHVEGMGFQPLGHFWATSGSKLYEFGGGELQPEIEDPWQEINRELDALITNVSAATMPNIIKHRLIDKLEYAKELKDNAHEECLADNFDAATKKLGVAKNQVESFASMVRITRRISAADKASFLADATEIIGKIDRLIEYIETEHKC